MQLQSKAKSSKAEPVLLSPTEAIDAFNYLLILDVQNPKYATHKIPKAQQFNLKILLKNVSKNQPILLTCLCGQRSLAAAHELISKGYRSVYVLKGGLFAWQQAGHLTQRLRLFA